MNLSKEKLTEVNDSKTKKTGNLAIDCCQEHVKNKNNCKNPPKKILFNRKYNQCIKDCINTSYFSSFSRKEKILWKYICIFL